MMRNIGYLLFIFLIGCLTPSCASASRQYDVIDLQLRWSHQFQFAGYYAAVEKGFYAAEGLDVRLHAGDPLHQPVQEVLEGRAQYAEGNSEVLYQRLLGKPLVALAAIFQHSPSALLVRKDSGVVSAQNLVGKRVMLLNGADDVEILAMFLNEGIPLSKINLIPSSYNVDDLISGRIDAFNSYLTNETYFLRKRNIPYSIIDPSKYMVDFYSDILFTSESELRDHPQRVDALRRATLKGWRYAMDHPEEIIDLLIKKYHAGKTRDHLEFEAVEMRKIILPDLIEIGHMNPWRWQHMGDTFVKAGLVKSGYSLDGFIYDATPRRTPRWVLTVLITAIVVIIAISSFTYYLLRLNRRLARAKATMQESEAKFSSAYEHATVGMVIILPEGRWVKVNQAVCDLLGYSATELLTKTFRDITHPEDIQVDLTQLKQLLAGDIQEYRVERRYLHRTGHIVWGWLGVSVVRTPEGLPRFLISQIVDITERKLSELRERHHNRVLAMLTTKAPLAAVLNTIALNAEAINPGVLCSIHLLDREGKHLRYGAAPSLPEPYSNALDGLAIGQGIGSCGTASFSGKRVIVENIETHPWWGPYRHLARHAGLGACWSEPIVSAQGTVLGTFSVYHSHARLPSPADLQFIEDEARRAALAIEKTTAESRLQLAASVFAHAREGIMITDSAGTIIEVNDTFSHITGYPREVALGQNPRILKSDRHGADFYSAMWQALAGDGHWHGEIWNRRREADLYAALLTISAVRDANGTVQNYAALFTDISVMKEQQRQLEHIAHYDALTNLPNRVLLTVRQNQAMLQSQRHGTALAVAYLDLDGFKAVNDRHGHDVGDELLIVIAQRMQTALREGDTLARIGGDEFVAVLVDLARPQDCEPVLAQLLEAAARPVTVGASVLEVSVSIGVTFYPQDEADADQLVRHADQAMYQAKQAGRNRSHLFDVDGEAAVRIQRESLERIRRALEQREFVLHYQPKVNMKAGTVIGAEALIRWQHPERGLLPPVEFLPAIEDHPLSVELGEWVISSALAQIAEWHAGGVDIPVSVNVGARQLQQSNFALRLSELLAKQPDVQPSRLELEILETSALEDMAMVSELMQTCRVLGVSFALDDFGTGYSSLTYLRRLPAARLKIDRSFVRDMLDDPDDLAIVKGVVGLATAFRREVIAEGVETAAHGGVLLSLGCELAQGYGIARPMSGAELPGWAAAWNPDPAWLE